MLGAFKFKLNIDEANKQQFFFLLHTPTQYKSNYSHSFRNILLFIVFNEKFTK